MADVETLSEMQCRFVSLIGNLIAWAYAQPGYGLTFGEAYRTPEQAALDAKKGSGIAHSLHTDRLAVDLNLFISGVYQGDTEAYEPMGVYWESLGGAWGGRFKRADGNHFSLAYQGRQ
jgi:hypothetical protein